MCGIGGKIAFGSRPEAGLGNRMAEQMVHRGPDADGVYVEGPAMLTHRRLSILDLTPAGTQPMSNADGSVHIVFNGEIYNYRELRSQIDSYQFDSETDTEVLLHLYEEYGIDCLSMLRGMFSFAIWDERDEKLILARDRFGQKPLFYHNSQSGITFASSIAALLADKKVPQSPDLRAIRSYLTYQYVPTPSTGFEGIKQLEPGEYAVVDKDGMQKESYWSLSYSNQFTAGPSELADKLRNKLKQATRLRMRSDVPIGVFLSGGVDSTIVTGLMDEVSDTDIETYSIGFGEYDEFEFARAVANEYDTDHTEYTVKPDAMDVLPELVRKYEMPFGDPSALPTYYVSQVASDDITVAVTGDAGDENFAGYDRYTYDWLTQRAGRVPKPLREAGKKALDTVPHPGAQRALSLLTNAEGDAVERYASYICHMQGESVSEVWAGPEPNDELASLREAYNSSDGPTHLDRILHTDIQTYLADDLLLKADRASMAHSLELRSPFLDHEIVEFTSKIPGKYKWRRGEKKWLLKQAFESYIPETVKGRKKQGFSVPVHNWFRDSLREFAREKFASLGSRDPFDRNGLDSKLERHIAGDEDLGYHIWDLVLLEQWYEIWIDT